MNGRQEPALPAGMTGAHAAGGCPPQRRGNSSDTACGCVERGMGSERAWGGTGMDMAQAWSRGEHRHRHGVDVGLRKT